MNQRIDQIINAEIIGDKELIKTLENIDKKFADKVLKSMVSSGLTPISRRARALARGQNIKKMISKTVWKNQKKQITGKVYLNPKKTERKITLEGREVGFEVVGQILEFGRPGQKSKSSGNAPPMAPKPFMRPAKEQAKEETKVAMVKTGRERLKKLAEKERSKKKI